MGKERIFLFPGNEELGFLEYTLKCFILLIFIDIYKSRRFSPWDPACYESAKTIHSPHPGFKIIEQSWRPWFITCQFIKKKNREEVLQLLEIQIEKKQIFPERWPSKAKAKRLVIA